MSIFITQCVYSAGSQKNKVEFLMIFCALPMQHVTTAPTQSNISNNEQQGNSLESAESCPPVHHISYLKIESFDSVKLEGLATSLSLALETSTSDLLGGLETVYRGLCFTPKLPLNPILTSSLTWCSSCNSERC